MLESTVMYIQLSFWFCCFVFISCPTPPCNSFYLLAQNLIRQFLSQHQKTILQCFAIFMTACNIISAVNFLVLLLKIFCLWSGVVSIDYAVILDSHIY